MSNQPEGKIPETSYTEARARAGAKLEFFKHVLAYVIVIGGLASINLLTSSSYLWFLWPAFGWGVGLLIHAANVFVFSDQILDRMTERELRRADDGRGPSRQLRS